MHDASTPGWFDASSPLFIIGCALLSVLAHHINNDVLFAWTAVTDYRHWLYVPAGIKLVLVMLFGWRGALGVTLGLWVYLAGKLPMLDVAEVSTLAMALGFAPLLAVRLFSRWTGLVMPWHGIQGYHLPVLALLSAMLCALSFHGLLVVFGIEPGDKAPSRMVTMLIGDFLGAGFLMLTVVGVRMLLRRCALLN